MAVLRVEEHRQLNGEDILKVILKPTKPFPDGAYFYCDSCDEKLVRSYTWCLQNQKEPYVIAGFGGHDNHQILRFHREKARNILEYYPDYINHVNGIEFDNINLNLDEVTNQQNLWARQSRGYGIVGRSFQPKIMVDSQQITAQCVRTEVDAIQSAYQLELQYENYRYDFLGDRRKDLDLLDMERTGQISEDEAIYLHVLRYAANNAWYVYRYDLFDYFNENHIPIPAFSIDSDGFMTHPVTGQRLCPL